MTAAIANQEMAEAWEHEAEGWIEHADRYDRAGVHLWERFVASTPVAAEAVVLDVGCGTGGSTLELARMASGGTAVGVDISQRMIEHAREVARRDGVANVSFEVADAQVHPFEAQRFDLAVSVFGTMFFADPVAAFANIRHALRPGGRLAMLVWREMGRNEWLTAVRDALALGRALPEPPAGAPGPFSLAGASRVAGVLTDAGFTGVDLEALDEPMHLGDDTDDAMSFLRTFGIVRGLTEGLEPGDVARAMDALHDVVRAHETERGVLFGTSAWLATATAPAS